MNTQPQIMLHQAIQAFHSGEHSKAEEILRKFTHMMSDHVDAMHLLAIVCASQGKHIEAILIYQRALNLNPNHASALSNLASSLNAVGQNDEAFSILKKALSINPAAPEFWFNAGNILCELERLEDALVHYAQAIKLNPEYFQAHNNYGKTLFDLDRTIESLAHYDRALEINQYFLEAFINKGAALSKLNRHKEAIICYDEVLAHNPRYAEGWSNKGLALNALNHMNEALTHFNAAVEIKPDYVDGWIKKGNLLNQLKRFEEAIDCYDRAIAINPDHADAWLNKGNAFYGKGCYKDAIIYYEVARNLTPKSYGGWLNMASALYELNSYDEAIAHYEAALSIKPDLDVVAGNVLHLKMAICKWNGLNEALASASNKILEDKWASDPFPLLSLVDDPSLHQKASEIYVLNKCKFNYELEPIKNRCKEKQIRIGYFSPDFRDHPISLLTTELFELHDRSRFDVFGFSLRKPSHDDKIRGRLINAFDQFFEVDRKSDSEIANLARDLNIDIAIDLAGHTNYSRPGIFYYRAAPIQVNWLGYPGTLGADFIDYIVADRVIIPESNQQFFTEKVAYLPHTYIVDDSKRIPSSRVFTREECGLPESAFVFACFNNGYKFNPQTVDGWARILLSSSDSVLWISENNSQFKENILKEFERRGIKSNRVVFAGRLDLMADHLARLCLADLFLDTYPYNAHTTALDSLKAGVPVLTLAGKAFASRVAASLLNTVGLSQLVTKTQEDYELLAIHFALNQDELRLMKEKMAKNLLESPLFKTNIFASNLELAYERMMDRYRSDLEPDHIYIN